MVELSALTLKVSMVLGTNINHRLILKGLGAPPGPIQGKSLVAGSCSLVDVTVPSL